MKQVNKMNKAGNDTSDIRQQAHYWRARMDDHILSDDEQLTFEAWLQQPGHAAAFADAERLWLALGEVEFPEQVGQPLFVEKFRAWLKWVKRNFFPRAFSGLVATAFMAILVLLTPLMLVFSGATEPFVSYTSAKAEVKKVLLADGSTLTLAPESKVKVRLNEEQRLVQLDKGITYFEVSQDRQRPFYVDVDNTRITVIGTAFEVQKRSDEVKLAVNEGKVKFMHLPSVSDASAELAQSVLVITGQGVFANTEQGLGNVVELGTEKVASWRSGQLIYVSARLDDIVEDINRYSQRTIRIAPDIGDMKLSATLQSDDIEEVLQTLTEALPLKTIELGNQVMLVRK